MADVDGTFMIEGTPAVVETDDIVGVPTDVITPFIFVKHACNRVVVNNNGVKTAVWLPTISALTDQTVLFGIIGIVPSNNIEKF
jgi:hypothetical protein